jgi:hypothetical protein
MALGSSTFRQQNTQKQEQKQEHPQKHDKKSQGNQETKHDTGRPEKANSGQSDSGKNTHKKQCDPDQEKCTQR